MRALTNKIDEVEGILKHNNVDVAAITETWMSPRIPVECTDISGYNVFRKLRKEGHCGGVALYIKDTIPSQHLDITLPDGLECLWMRICPQHLPREVPCIIVAAIYNPPKSSAEKKLLEHISQSVTELKAKYPSCGRVISGNFNKADMSNVRDRTG